MPQRAGSRNATVWLGLTREPPPDLQLQAGLDQPIPVPTDWSVWEAKGQPRHWSQRVELAGLEPGRRYPLRLLDSGVTLASGTAATLPLELPPLSASPFVCMIGSCFAYLSDRAGAAGAAYAGLPAAAQPHVKFLAGDQVYLDAPFPRYLFALLGEQDLRTDLLATYIATWAQGDNGWGFSELLRNGSTFFCSDDHEFWNNAPSPTPTVRTTWWPFGDHGAAWLRLARELYTTFQSPARHETFSVDRLSFMVLDTRIDRTADRSRFCDPASLDALRTWVDALVGPGALVVGQPILTARTGFKGNFTDWGLADFDQYEDLVRIMSRTTHDLLILTGDVHFGRVAGFELAAGQRIVEIVSSPFALVDPRVGGKWSAPPPLFPEAALAGTNPRRVWVDQTYQLTTNQFSTLEFNAAGPRVQVNVRSWPIPQPGTAPTSKTVFTSLLN